jgi:hypothetical protein
MLACLKFELRLSVNYLHVSNFFDGVQLIHQQVQLYDDKLHESNFVFKVILLARDQVWFILGQLHHICDYMHVCLL